MNKEASSHESLLKSRKQYIRLTIIFLFALALLHGIHFFFFTLFFWLSIGSGALALFNHIQWKRDLREEEAEVEEEIEVEPSVRNPIKHQPTRPTFQSLPAKSKQVVTIVAFAFGLFFILPILISVFSDKSSVVGDGGSSSSGDQVATIDEAMYSEAVQFYNQSDYRGAINLLKPVVMNGIEDRQSIVLLGDSYYGEKNLDSAYVWYSKAYDLGKRSSALLYLIAYILDTKGSTVEAVSYYKEAVSMDSSLTDIYVRLSELEPENSSRYIELSKRFE